MMEATNDLSHLQKLLQSLKKYGYKGDCVCQTDLHWALRVGALSWQYHEMLDWLEDALYSHGYYYEIEEVKHLWGILRRSHLMKRTEGTKTNPMVFRSKAILKIVQAIHNIFLRKENEIEIMTLTKSSNITFCENKDYNDHKTPAIIRPVEKECTAPMDFSTAKNWWNR